MLKRLTRLSLLTLALVATFATGMLFAQRTHTPPAKAADRAVIMSIVPIITSQTQEVDANGQKTDATITTTRRILVIYSDGRTRELNVQPDGHFRFSGF